MAQAPAPPLWEEIQWSGSYVPTPQAIRSKAVRIDIRRLQPPSNDSISLLLPDGNQITAQKVIYEETDKQRFIWHGSIEGDKGGVVTFSVVNDTIAGDIVTSQGRMYRVRSVADDVSILEQLDPAKFPAEGTPSPRKGTPSPRVRARLQSEVRALQSAPPGDEAEGTGGATTEGTTTDETDGSDGATTIDVLVLYTSAARDAVAATKPITPTIDLAIFNTKLSYQNSKIAQRIRLVGTELMDYQEKGDIAQDWEHLKSKSDAELSAAHDLRQSRAADVVILITKPANANESCGQASQMQQLTTAECAFAFAVVPVNCATGRHSFAHELGHLMGADHNKEKGTNGPPFPYSHGYETPTKAWHTIMAYPTVSCVGEACPPRVLYWSNPDVSNPKDGLATGNVEEANNALTLNNTASTVAAFYPSPECGGLTPATPPPPQTPGPQTPAPPAPPPPKDISVQ